MALRVKGASSFSETGVHVEKKVSGILLNLNVGGRAHPGDGPMPHANCILLVDESKVFLNLYRQFLRTTPAEIREARSAAEALAICRHERPSLVYMSYDLPDGNGADCCRQLRTDERLRHVPVILICDRRDPAQEASCRQVDCNGVLTRPIDRIRFLDLGRNFLFGIREIRRPCRVVVQCGDGGRTFATRGLDICSGGIFLEGCETLAPNTALKLQIHLGATPQSPSIDCAGEVAWINRRAAPRKPSHPCGIGIRFTAMTAEASGALADFLETLNYRVTRADGS